MTGRESECYARAWIGTRWYLCGARRSSTRPLISGCIICTFIDSVLRAPASRLPFLACRFPSETSARSFDPACPRPASRLLCTVTLSRFTAVIVIFDSRSGVAVVPCAARRQRAGSPFHPLLIVALSVCVPCIYACAAWISFVASAVAGCAEDPSSTPKGKFGDDAKLSPPLKTISRLQGPFTVRTCETVTRSNWTTLANTYVL